jgi:hypothetical protein
MLIWRTQSKKINSSSNIDLTRTSVVVAGEAVMLMVVEVEVVGTRMAVAVAVGTRMAVSEAVGTRMAVVEVVVGTRMAVAEAVDTTIIVDITSKGTITAEAVVMAILTMAIRVEAHMEVAMDILGGWSWVPTLSFLTIVCGVREKSHLLL